MSKFINTIDLLGDDTVIDSIIDRTITEFRDDMLTNLGSYAFYSCQALQTIDLPVVESVNSQVFANCIKLENVNLPLLNQVGERMFRGCTSLKSIDLPNVTSSTGYLAFEGCRALRSLKIPNATEIGPYSLQACTSLTKLDLPSVKKIYAGGLQSPNLVALILRYNSVVKLDNTNAFSGKIVDGTGYIYVPRALIEDYKVAANWSTYASQFRVLEDYTVDGTTTGELDESKI